MIPCASCPAGKYQAGNSGPYSYCAECPAGYFHNQPGMTACVACPAGRFQSATGQIACNVCPGGTWQSATGQSSCVACDVYNEEGTGSYSTAYTGLTSQAACVCSAMFSGQYCDVEQCPDVGATGTSLSSMILLANSNTRAFYGTLLDEYDLTATVMALRNALQEYDLNSDNILSEAEAVACLQNYNVVVEEGGGLPVWALPLPPPAKYDGDSFVDGACPDASESGVYEIVMSYASAIATRSEFLYSKFKSGEARDRSDNEFDGSVNGATEGDGLRDDGLVFDGVDDSVSFPSEVVQGLSGDWTVCISAATASSAAAKSCIRVRRARTLLRPNLLV